MSRYVWAVPAGLILVGLAAWLLPSETTGVTEPPSRKENEPAKDSLFVRSRTDRLKAGKGEKIRFWVTFENHSGENIDALRFVQFEMPGFQEAGPCWRDHAPGCLAGQAAPISQSLRLKAGTSQTLWAELEPAAGSGRFSLFGVYAWEAGSAEWHGTFESKPIVVTGYWSGFESWFQRFVSLAKDLAMPVAIALIGFLVQRSQQERSAQQEVLKAELPRLQEFNEQHYFPIVTSIRGFIETRKRYENCQTDTDKRKHSELMLGWLLLFWRRMIYLRSQRGMVFFQDRAGEKVLQLAWIGALHHLENRFGEDYEIHLLHIDPQDPLPTFHEKSKGWREKWRETLVNWSAEQHPAKGQCRLAECQELLLIMREVFTFEANRPFDKYWYQSKPYGFKVRKSGGYSLPVDPEETMKDLRTTLDDYVTETEKFIKKSPS